MFLSFFGPTGTKAPIGRTANRPKTFSHNGFRNGHRFRGRAKTLLFPAPSLPGRRFSVGSVLRKTLSSTGLSGVDRPRCKGPSHLNSGVSRRRKSFHTGRLSYGSSLFSDFAFRNGTIAVLPECACRAAERPGRRKVTATFCANPIGPFRQKVAVIFFPCGADPTCQRALAARSDIYEYIVSPGRFQAANWATPTTICSFQFAILSFLVPTLRVGTHCPDALRPRSGTSRRTMGHVAWSTRSVRDVRYDAKRRNEVVDGLDECLLQNAARSGPSARAAMGARLRVPAAPRLGPFSYHTLGVVTLRVRARRSRGATENPVEAFGGAGQLDGARKTPQYRSEGHIPTQVADLIESLCWPRLRPMIDNLGPLGQTQG